MSITLMRTKNGKQVPLKLSIWDAFKGAPVPKPRTHKCNSCGRLHKPACKSKPEALANGKSSKKDEAKKSYDGEQKDNSGFSPEDDAKIKKIKAEEPSCAWTKVAEALDNKHSKDACKARYKELQDAEKKGDSGETREDDGAKKDKGKDKKGEEKDEKEDNEASQKQMTKKEKKKQAAKDAKDAQKKEDEAPAEATKITGEATTSNPSASDKQKWASLASKHFDRTGQRVTLEQARKMMEDTT